MCKYFKTELSLECPKFSHFHSYFLRPTTLVFSVSKWMDFYIFSLFSFLFCPFSSLLFFFFFVLPALQFLWFIVTADLSLMKNKKTEFSFWRVTLSQWGQLLLLLSVLVKIMLIMFLFNDVFVVRAVPMWLGLGLWEEVLILESAAVLISDTQKY